MNENLGVYTDVITCSAVTFQTEEGHGLRRLQPFKAPSWNDCSPSKNVRRDWSRVNGFDEALSNAVGYDFFLRLSNITKILSVEDVLYNYRIHDTSTSVRQRGVQTENTKRVQRNYLRMIGHEAWDIRRDYYDAERAIEFFEKQEKRSRRRML